jgi:ER-bound oxygenase mpaB/B'/Rubber oxygenase, catalytic domain
VPSSLAAMLDEARQLGDVEADAAVEMIGKHVWAINALLREVRDNDASMPPQVPRSIHNLVLPCLPSSADLYRIRRAQRFADRHMPAIAVSLFCGSLPASYTVREGAKILAATGRMKSDIDRRVNETIQFVLDVLQPHGLERGGRGLIAIGKVRLVHAAVRAALRKKATGSLPINQEHMLGTLGLFSALVLRSIQRLGAEVDARDAEDFIYLWSVVGAMLGIESRFLPSNLAAANEMLDAINKRHYEPSPEGRDLMAVLLSGMERHTAPVGLRHAPNYLIHHLLDEDVATALGCPPPSKSWGRMAGLAVRALSPRAITAAITPLAGRRLMAGMTLAYRQGIRMNHFEMPVLMRLAGIDRLFGSGAG